MNKLMSTAAIAVAAIGLSGCATVLNGTSQPMEFQSDPDGATIELISGLSCVTPCEYEMKRGDDSMVTFTKDGYEPVSVYIQSRLGGSTFGNIIAGGIVGGVVDGSNGASNRLYPRPVYVRMVAEGSDEEALLLDEDGEVISSVAEYNAEVADDVIKGLEKQGLYAKGTAGAAIAEEGGSDTGLKAEAGTE